MSILIEIMQKIEEYIRDNGRKPKYLLVSPSVLHKEIKPFVDKYSMPIYMPNDGTTPSMVYGLEIAVLDMYEGRRLEVAL